MISSLSPGVPITLGGNSMRFKLQTRPERRRKGVEYSTQITAWRKMFTISKSVPAGAPNTSEKALSPSSDEYL